MAEIIKELDASLTQKELKKLTSVPVKKENLIQSTKENTLKQTSVEPKSKSLKNKH